MFIFVAPFKSSHTLIGLTYPGRWVVPLPFLYYSLQFFQYWKEISI